ncbi:MAG: FtsQ-type POTRA domain-containing protein [Deltaproteobacteria bacterium]|nr:FtsQ-type POTRA domain-containing protein [Deltaproteobacteria bacterium]
MKGWRGKGSSPRNVRVRPRSVEARPGLGERLRAWWRDHDRDPEPAQTQAEEDEVELEPSEASTSAWVAWLTWGTAAFCVCIVALAVLNLHEFQTRVETGVASKFEVFGNKRVTDQQVIQLSTLRWGDALTHVDRDYVARNVEKLPWVRHADVEAQLPNRVVFTVQEYEPYALLLGDGKLMIVDANGHVFKEAELGEAGDLPVITGFSAQLHREAHVRTTAEAQSPEQRRLQTVLRLIQAHGASAIAERFPLSELHYDAVLGTTLVSARDGAEVRLGKALAGDPERAFGLMARVLDRARAEGQWLRYALLDDELRPERVVVRTERATLAGGAGGASAAALPKAVTAAAQAEEPQIED